MNKKQIGLSVGIASLIAIGAVVQPQVSIAGLTQSSSVSKNSTVESFRIKEVSNVLNDKKIQAELTIKSNEVAVSNYREVALESNKTKAVAAVVEKPVVKNVQKSEVKIQDNTAKKVEPKKVETVKVEAAKKEEPKVKLSGKVETKDSKKQENKVEVKTTQKEVAKVENKKSVAKLSSKQGVEIEVPKVEGKDKAIKLPVEGWVSNNLNVRQKATTASNIVGVLTVGTKVSGLEVDGWVEFNYNGTTSYVSKAFISSKEIKAPVIEAPKTEAPKVSAPKKEEPKKETPKKEEPKKEEPKKEAPKKEEPKKETPKKEETKQTSTSSVSSSGQSIANAASKYLGYRYVFGKASPSTGFDCSGLVYYLYGQAGVSLNRSSASQVSNGFSVSRDSIKPGDLLFFATSGGSRISHVGIYVGNGQMIHASTPSTGVIKSNINTSYYQKTFVAARRIFN